MPFQLEKRRSDSVLVTGHLKYSTRVSLASRFQQSFLGLSYRTKFQLNTHLTKSPVLVIN